MSRMRKKDQRLDREWLVKAKRAEEQLSKFLVKAAQVQQMVQENTALEAAEEVEFLQTKTIPTQEAMQELEKWRESLSDEVTSLVKELEVVEPTTQEKLDKLAEEPNAPYGVDHRWFRHFQSFSDGADE